MKRLTLTVLLLLLTVTSPVLSATENGNMSNILTENATDTPPLANPGSNGISAQDLSLFGVISLGVIGLFWIRRHTSEL